jgi:hypothetical protein
MNNKRIPQNLQVSNFQTGPVDFYTAVFMWGGDELSQLRSLKYQISREPNKHRRQDLETSLRVRCNRYITIVGRAMSELRHDPRFFTLSPSERAKVAGWATLYESNQVGV